MELNEYQERAMQTCMPSCDNFSYMMLNLVGEVGEVSKQGGERHPQREYSNRQPLQ